ncbi:uncharacterized protein LOC117785633 [Drosophila innubila]|uniref:uncharacterized protein LOC117785633 n=1 Tax=Drosophila innubila TaxID=198719 RepID=UPI00148C1F18|nr:uncharacterized protein LOC117785633 [Drosophila innubila]XP_034479632.1 uncharacterized protein LOC117785633 [Drosophila innubila]
MDTVTDKRTSKRKKKKQYIYTTRISRRTIYRTLYWTCVFVVLAALCVGLHYSFKADFGQCTSYDIKCN